MECCHIDDAVEIGVADNCRQVRFRFGRMLGPGLVDGFSGSDRALRLSHEYIFPESFVFKLFQFVVRLV